jgi:hypothetical protein
MIAQRVSLIVLAFIAAFVSATEPATGNSESPPQIQEKAGENPVQFQKASDDEVLVHLLVSETVQKDLGLTADQIGQYDDLVKAFKAMLQEAKVKSHEIFPPSQHFTPEEFEAKQRDWRAWMEDFKSKSKEMNTKALAILTPTQTERLKQIHLQTAIVAALTQPEIVKALDLSEEQVALIRELGGELQRKVMAEFPNLRNFNAAERLQKLIEHRKKMEPIRAETQKRILAVLTPEQRTQFGNLQGKKVDTVKIGRELIPDVESMVQ